MSREDIISEIAALHERVLRLERNLGALSEARHNESTSSCDDLNNAFAELCDIVMGGDAS